MDRTKDKGFTLIEIISIMVIAGILSTVVIVRMNVLNQSNLYTFADELKANLRYAQNHSMTTESICSIIFSGNTYKYQDGSSTDTLLPGQNQILLTAPSGVSISVVPPFIAFDSWGRPGIDPNKTDINGDILLDVSAGTQITLSNSEENRILIVTQETGYIRFQ